VLLWYDTDLCPLPAEERHGVGIGGITGDLVALAEGFHGFSPVARGDSLGVVVDGPEVERRAVAGEVTRVRRRVRVESGTPTFSAAARWAMAPLDTASAGLRTSVTSPGSS
jgi:hypothetical protein